MDVGFEIGCDCDGVGVLELSEDDIEDWEGNAVFEDEEIEANFAAISRFLAAMIASIYYKSVSLRIF